MTPPLRARIEEAWRVLRGVTNLPAIRREYEREIARERYSRHKAVEGLAAISRERDAAMREVERLAFAAGAGTVPRETSTE